MKKTISNFLDESVEELEKKNKLLNTTLNELKSTQAQLIQSEKNGLPWRTDRRDRS